MPVRGEVAEGFFQAEGHLHVGEGVAAQVDEAVVLGGVGPVKDHGVQRAEVGAAAGCGPVGGGLRRGSGVAGRPQRADGPVVGLAVGEPGQFGQHVDVHGAGRQAVRGGDQAAYGVGVGVAGGGHRERVVGAGGQGGDAVSG